MCVKGEQVWRVFTLLGGVCLGTWQNGGQMIIRGSLSLLSTLFHSLQFFIFLFTSMACPAEEMLSC